MIRYSTLKRISVGVCVALILDQGSKYFVQSVQTVRINEGISFGLFPLEVLPYVLLGFLICLSVCLYQSLFQKFPIAFGLFVGGSLSNITDRFLFGGVRDFLPLPSTGITNNVADWLIGGALVYMLTMSIRNTKTV